MGDSLKMAGSVSLHVDMPDSQDVETQIIREGKVIGTYHNIGSINIAVGETGEYRVQAFQYRTMLPLFTKRSFPWILSNPIYVYR